METSVESLSLTILRTIRGWGQKELARAAGLDADTISAYERRRSPPPETLSHLATLMGYPQSMVERTLAFVGAAREWLEPASSPEGRDTARREIELLAADQARRYEEFLRQSLHQLDGAAEAVFERREAPRLWRRLSRHPAGRRTAVIEVSKEFWSWGLVELLCEESADAISRNPREAEELARLALDVARRVPGSEAWQKRVTGYAGFFLGHALRAQGRRTAEEAFVQASRLWQAGSPADSGWLDPSRPLELEAAFRRQQRRLNDAMELLERALAAARHDKATGRILLEKARIFTDLDDPQGAMAILRQAALHVERSEDPVLLSRLRAQLLEAEMEGRSSEARPIEKKEPARQGRRSRSTR